MNSLFISKILKLSDYIFKYDLTLSMTQEVVTFLDIDLYSITMSVLSNNLLPQHFWPRLPNKRVMDPSYIGMSTLISDDNKACLFEEKERE